MSKRVLKFLKNDNPIIGVVIGLIGILCFELVQTQTNQWVRHQMLVKSLVYTFCGIFILSAVGHALNQWLDSRHWNRQYQWTLIVFVIGVFLIFDVNRLNNTNSKTLFEAKKIQKVGLQGRDMTILFRENNTCRFTERSVEGTFFYETTYSVSSDTFFIHAKPNDYRDLPDMIFKEEEERMYHYVPSWDGNYVVQYYRIDKPYPF